MEVGELVKWYEMYTDLMIVRREGLGVILSSHEYKFHDFTTLIYKVYRPTLQDTISLEECYVEKILGEKNES